jgi:hypothetical protein
MIPISEPSLAEQRDLEALLAFDRALVTGAGPRSSATDPLLDPLRRSTSYKR